MRHIPALFLHKLSDSASKLPPNLQKYLKTMEKLGISLEEQKRLTGVAVDIVMDSVSVATTFKETLAEKGIIFCLSLIHI